jgi:hypothetical protein
MGKRLIFMVLLLLVVASELLLPTVMSTVVSQSMMKLTGSDHVEAKLSKSPAVLMLDGEFDKITMLADHVKVDKIVFSQMNIALTNAQLDMGKLLSSRVVEIKSVDDVTIAAVVGQDDLAQYLNHSVKGIKNAVVVITPDKVKASSTFAIGGLINVAVSLEGRIVGDGQKIKFVTDRFLINNTLTGNIGGSLLTEIPLVDLNKLPFHVGVRDIVMENEKVTINLDNHSH